MIPADLFTVLREPILELPTLLGILAAPLDSLGLLKPSWRNYKQTSLEPGSLQFQRHVPVLQQLILTHIAPTWSDVLAEDSLSDFLLQFFCPDIFSFTLPVAGDIAVLAYSTILSIPLTETSIDILDRLTLHYPIDRLHKSIFESDASPPKRQANWTDYLRNFTMVPDKVSNALGARKQPPLHLGHSHYFEHASIRTEMLIEALSADYSNGEFFHSTIMVDKYLNI